jgi:16S rRNA (guanine527-N7)-methyltransferase
MPPAVVRGDPGGSVGPQVLDFGSGAGIPGVPLAIVLPTVRFTLLESRQRRASFLYEVIRQLELSNCSVFQGRAEEAAELYGRYDAVVVRCAGDYTQVAVDALRFGKTDAPVIISGPPARTETEVGSWIEIESGADPSMRRRFLVVTR